MKHIHPIIKSIAVAILATLIAYGLGVTNYLTAGIIAMISIQKTKMLSLEIALNRTLLVVLSLVVSTLLFVLINYNILAYSIFIIFVVFVGYTFKLESGIIPSVVVVTHLLLFGSFSIEFIFETLLLYLISIGTALLFNLFYPSESMIKLTKYQEILDETIKEHIANITQKLEKQNITCSFSNDLEEKIQDALNHIDQITGDLIMRNHQDVLRYSKMRSKQFDILVGICSLSDQLSTKYKQTDNVIEYLKQLSDDIGLDNKATTQIEQIDKMLNRFKQDDLPKTRNEFEDRAILYHIVLEIKQFLLIKEKYHYNQLGQ